MSIFETKLEPDLKKVITTNLDLKFDRQLVQMNAASIAGLLEGTQAAFKRSMEYETVQDSALSTALCTLWKGLIYFGTGTDPYDTIFSKGLSKEGDQNE